MKKTIMIVLKYSGILIGVLGLLLAGVIIFGTITNYTPPDIEEVYKTNKKVPQLDTSFEYSVLIWNIGYCGLGEDMDFFYDGGTRMRTSEEITKMNLNKIGNFLLRSDADFVLLQEVDVNSKRSYHINEKDTLQNNLFEHKGFYTQNYNVKFVPMPFTNPMGKVNSGLFTLSKYEPTQVDRYAYKSEFSWPKNVFMLDRCFMVNRYPVNNGKELLIINTHNSAYDLKGDLLKKEMNLLKIFIETEYKKGNYVLVGGDWNQLPPKYSPDFDNNVALPGNNPEIENKFMPLSWDWAYDNRIPSNRDLMESFVIDRTGTRVIDFFLVSPNIITVSVKGFNLNFENSDHNPVKMILKLK
jgi:endonuclease/exonuclease/phosphatase family metal-dependent hydrolase